MFWYFILCHCDVVAVRCVALLRCVVVWCACAMPWNGRWTRYLTVHSHTTHAHTQVDRPDQYQKHISKYHHHTSFHSTATWKGIEIIDKEIVFYLKFETNLALLLVSVKSSRSYPLPPPAVAFVVHYFGTRACCFVLIMYSSLPPVCYSPHKQTNRLPFPFQISYPKTSGHAITWRSSWS